MNHTVSGQASTGSPAAGELGQHLTAALAAVLSQEVRSQRRPRGRPRELCESHLWLSLLLSLLGGMRSYQDWWRRLCSSAIGPFQPLALTDDALLKRLRQAGVAPVRQLFSQVRQGLAQRLAGHSSTALAPFASQILARDRGRFDRLNRPLPRVRGETAG